MNRKHFIRAGCMLCIGMMLPIHDVVANAKTKKYKASLVDGTLTVPLAEIADDNMLILKNKELEFNILLIRKEGEFKALQMMCTHEGVPVTLSGETMHCSAHGSRFDFDGNVLQEPALKPLIQYEVSLNNNSILINTTKSK
ncbi:MAG: Rieske (2Fe-2S) protein [Chitinophagaceae bacterium]|nr:Rieske (2Fe-2S) protein [Chitinophagaceae bacterium]